MNAPSGSLHAINTSPGGVPKLPRAFGDVRTTGIIGDHQNFLFHGGPSRAVSLYSLELIALLRAEGHPISPGSIGENLTVSGLCWTDLVPGARLGIGAVVIEATSYASPCRKIAASFVSGDRTRVSQRIHPGWSRVYGRVLTEGTVRPGDPVRLVPR